MVKLPYYVPMVANRLVGSVRSPWISPQNVPPFLIMISLVLISVIGCLSILILHQ